MTPDRAAIEAVTIALRNRAAVQDGWDLESLAALAVTTLQGLGWRARSYATGGVVHDGRPLPIDASCWFLVPDALVPGMAALHGQTVPPQPATEEP